MWPWPRQFADRYEVHRPCGHCSYDLYGTLVEWRVFPNRRRWLGRCVWCPECGELNSLDVPLPRRTLSVRESLFWLIPAALLVLLATGLLLWLLGLVLR
ncbi:MAG TPA: hypothetical protein P5572_19135 [Phycisphaerae bacterium]|nr:hypothetical protein [Phycisphaerales bacterium]HRX87146.1 hypothetical protein [Phycisphaerae bacterium]